MSIKHQTQYHQLQTFHLQHQKNLTITSANFWISTCEWKFYYFIYLTLLSVLTDIISVTLLYRECDLRAQQSSRQFPFFHPPLRSLGLYVCGSMRTNTYLFCSSKIVYEKPAWTLRGFKDTHKRRVFIFGGVWGCVCVFVSLKKLYSQK